jgi:hypothetical protein
MYSSYIVVSVFFGLIRIAYVVKQPSLYCFDWCSCRRVLVLVFLECHLMPITIEC